MLALALALSLAAPPAAPTRPGAYRRAVTAADGTHLAVFLYRPERPIPGAPLLVLLPDLGATHEFFDIAGMGLARALADRGLTVATLDWRGTGLSQIPQRAPTLDDLLQLDVPAVADALGPEQPLVLVGWGYSGALAYAAAAGPLAKRTRAVVSLNGVVALDVPNAIVERLFGPDGGALALGRALATSAPQRRGNLFNLLWTHGSRVDSTIAGELLAHGIASLSEPQQAQVRAWMQRGSTTLGGKNYPQLLRELDVPVLAFLGTRDNWTHPEFAGPVRDYVPDARLVFAPVTKFEGFDEDLGHVGLVLGRTAEKQLVPLVLEFVRGRAMSAEAASR